MMPKPRIIDLRVKVRIETKENIHKGYLYNENDEYIFIKLFNGQKRELKKDDITNMRTIE